MQNHRRKNRISTIHDAEDRQYLSVPVMVSWGPGRLTLVQLNKRWRIGVLVVPMWRRMPEYANVTAFNLGLTSASIINSLWYAHVYTTEDIRLEARRSSDDLEMESPHSVVAPQFDIGTASFETMQWSLLLSDSSSSRLCTAQCPAVFLDQMAKAHEC